MELVRLNKYLKDQDICSRRKADEFIEQGYVLVNGVVVTELGTRVDPLKDIVTLSKKVEEVKQNFKYILLNKPSGYVCTRSDIDGRNIYELLPPIKNLSYAGRLDKDSHGLVILSDDGKFVYNVMGREFELEKEYIVRVNKPLTDNFLLQMSNGSIKLDGRQLKPAHVEQINDYVFKIVLTEGINRQIRRMAENQGYRVEDLKRVRIGQIDNKNLLIGEYRLLKIEEINSLKKILVQGKK